MTKLNGFESSALAFIAMFPLSQEAADKAESLTGEARQIAEALIQQPVEAAEPQTAAAAKAVHDWAEARP
jgi:hypothetical protein